MRRMVLKLQLPRTFEDTRPGGEDAVAIGKFADVFHPRHIPLEAVDHVCMDKDGFFGISQPGADIGQ